VHAHEGVSGSTSSGYTKDGHFPRISSKRLNVILHPLQRKALIQQPCIHNATPGYLMASKEAKSSELCLHKYLNDAA